jgi:hypothetical protein
MMFNIFQHKRNGELIHLKLVEDKVVAEKVVDLMHEFTEEMDFSAQPAPTKVGDGAYNVLTRYEGVVTRVNDDNTFVIRYNPGFIGISHVTILIKV